MTGETGRRAPSASKLLPIIGVGVAAAAAILPILVDDFAFNYLMSYMVITCILALTLHLLMGLAGVFSLGQAAMFGTGAYAAVMIIGQAGIDGTLGLILVAVVGAVIGLLMGLVTLRTTDLYLALTTLAFGYIVENLVRNADWLGGPQGITGFDITFAGGYLDEPKLLYWVGLGFLYLLIVIIMSVRRSKVGRALMATRESPIAARSIGIDTRRYKLLAFGIAGAFAAVAGGLYTAYALVVDPSVFGIDLTLSVLAIAIVGGLRSMPGIIVVAIALTYFRNSAETFGASQYVLLIYGLLIVLTLRFLPQGLGGLLTSPRVLEATRLIGDRFRTGGGTR
ncbi:branched-chain amino acid ABC transporter permease [Cryobacterium sp. TMS1-20-1]|uniref:branched-chain amino acid ABC transporter permease n=1 Tax=Cryobacterium sp. TMS1-20-1 TaxID=1259223 RepID=UPI00141B794B|nr:branched-chain amino acid ABC transporter permease [Cryobacterium sp. TMS1-20-1]